MRNYPFLRLLFPLIVGIAGADYLFFNGNGIPEFHWCAILFILILILTATFFIKQYFLRWIFGILVCLFFFYLGFTLSSHQLSNSVYEFPAERIAYRAILTSDGNTKTRSILYNADIIQGFDSVAFTVDRKALLYFPIDSVTQTLNRGDEILFYSTLALPRNNGNPDEFDYPRYLIRKGISGTGYVPAGSWKVVPRSVPVSLQESAYRCRDKILEIYKECGFEGEEYAVLSALTVGYKEELSEDIRESFSVSGVSHVLALSGLHVGFIFWLLVYILKRGLGSSTPALVFRSLLIIFVLWFFAFLTGFSPSVVRSVLMFSLLALISIRSSRLLTFHSLSLTCFLMLMFNPEWLFDVGFQLSFTAVAGIVLIQPKLYGLVDCKNRLLRYVWDLLTVSTAAQIATAPLVIFYFSRFATHFLLTNLLVIPLVTFIIYGAGIMLILFPFSWLQDGASFIVDCLLKLLNLTVRWVEQLPFSSIDNLWLTMPALAIIYLILLLVTTYKGRNKGKLTIYILACLLLLAIQSVWLHNSKSDYPSIAFYNVRNCPAVHCIGSNCESWLVCADSIPDDSRLTKNLSSHWMRKGIKQPELITENYSKNNLVRVDNFLSFAGKRVYVLNDNRWKNKHTDQPLAIDYLYICNGFTQKLESVIHLFNIQYVILDSSLPAYRRESIIEEARRLQIPCTSVADGAFILHC